MACPAARRMVCGAIFRAVCVLGVFVAFTCLSPHAAAQSIIFRNLTIDDGLPQLDVGVILQDPLGFMWFGTEDGLVRYDGTVLRVFRPVSFDSSSLSSSWIVGLAIDPDGSMWVATEGAGLNRYLPHREAFKRYPHGDTVSVHNLWAMLQASDGALWLGARDDNLSRFDPATGQSAWFVTDPANPDHPNTLADGQINAIAEDHDGRIWIGTDSGGIDCLDQASGVITNYRSDGGNRSDGNRSGGRAANAYGLPDDRVLAITVDARGTVWAGTALGLARYDAASDLFVEVPVPITDWPRTVSAIFEDPDGVLWLGTSDGLVRFDRTGQTEQAEQYRNDLSDPASIGAGAVRTIYLDRSGVMWVGTESGVSSFLWAGPKFERTVFDPKDPNSLSDPGVWSFFMDGDSLLWVGTEKGLDRFDERTGDVAHFTYRPGDPATLSPGWVVSLFEDSAGNFWVGTRRDGTHTGTLHRFDRATGRVVERYQQDTSDPTSMRSDNPWQLFEDSGGHLWVLSGGAGCHNRMNRADGTFESFCHDPTNPNSPTYNAAKKMAEVPDGVLWFATWGGGLNRFDTRGSARSGTQSGTQSGSGTWTAYRHDPDNRNSPSDDYLLTMYRAPDGTLWLGTYGAGLDRFDPATESFTHFNTSNSGLPNDVIYAIEGDADGHVWVSTNLGLARFDPANNRVRTFGLQHGLQDLEFNAVSSYRAPDGELFFGGIKGFNRFYPHDIPDDVPAANVVLTDIRVRGQPVVPAGDGADDREGPELERALPYAESISLGADEHDFSVSFANLDFTNPGLNRFRYRLIGYDRDWRQVDTDRSASYTNIDAGEYTLVVQATNSVGAWGEPGAQLSIVVRPHWARTRWAYLVYVLCAVGGVLFFVSNYRTRMLMRHGLELERVEAEKLRELDRTRSRFFANVSHEFRTPLTLTLGPLEDLQSGMYGTLSPDVMSQVELAKRNAGRVLDLINQILDVARIEAGRTPLRAHRLDIAGFLERVARAFAPLAKREKLTLTSSLPDVGDDVYADPQLLEKIVANLLSNAIKFTPEGGDVALRLESGADVVRIRVHDSGPGIPKDELPYIFDRFYRASESTTWNQLGTGIGLSLARELAELHGGLLSVESEPLVGSVFTLELRRGRDHLAPDQVVEGGEVGDSDPAALPIVEGQPLAAPEAGGAAAGTEGDGLGAKFEVAGIARPESSEETTVLIVDDNPEIRSYIRRHLEPTYHVLEAGDGEEGLAKVTDAPPDLIISDVMMPRMDGFAFCRALKSDPETDFIPVVLLTAKADHEDKLEGLQERADDYLTKPFRVDELLARVQNLIESRRRLKERFSARRDNSRVDTPVEPPKERPKEIRVATANAVSADKRFLQKVGEVVELHIDDEDFTVERFAAEVGLDRSQLYRRLQELVDQSPTDLVMNIRLERAAELLAARAGNVSEVAYAVGFKSVAHFSRRFKRQFDATPSAWRAAHSTA